MEKRDVYIVGGNRTPFLKMRGKRGVFSASDLAIQAGKHLLARYPILPSDLGEVIVGCVMPSAEEANIGRLIALRLGCGKAVPAWTVQRNCASGMQALDSAFQDIADGRHDLVVAGGTESMSHAPLLLSSKMVDWLAGLNAARSPLAKIKQVFALRPRYLSPVIALLKGLTDPTINLSMGQTAEILSYQFNITREEMDEFALESHRRVLAAQEHGFFRDEVVTAYGSTGDYYSKDDGVRQDTSLERLAQLKPFFDKKFGNVTAGNSSQVSDGAALLLLASGEAVKKYQLPVLARIVDVEWAGVEPREMGLGPVKAVAQLFTRLNLNIENIDFWEINEAFATQVLACLKAMESETFCQSIGLQQALGSIDRNRLNVDGGAVALGHPVGASGARIVLHLAEVLKRHQAKLGVAAICIGGGQGGAMLIESTPEVNA